MNKTKKSEWKIVSMRGYKPKTTLWDDFTSAEEGGTDAILNMYSNALLDNSSDIVALTELCMVLDWKHWEHYDSNRDIKRVYYFLWLKSREYIETHFKGEELMYYFKTKC